MKKLVLSFAAICAAVSLNAQIVNGNLETWVANEPSNWMYDFGGATGVAEGTNNWVAASFGEPLTTTQIAGATGGSGALLETKSAVSSTLIGAGFTEIEGMLLGEWTYTGVNPVSMSCDFDARPLTGDSAVLLFTVYNAAGDEMGFAGGLILPATATTGWVNFAFPFDYTGGAAGPAAKVEIWCQSSYSIGAGVAEVGSTLKVDNFVLNTSTAGIEEQIALELNVYPNPTSEVLNINTNVEAVSVSVISMDGKVVATQEMNGTSAIVNVSDLNAGAYFYEVKTVDGLVSRSTFMKK
jgi:hypothetical protein